MGFVPPLTQAGNRVLTLHQILNFLMIIQLSAKGLIAFSVFGNLPQDLFKPFSGLRQGLEPAC